MLQFLPLQEKLLYIAYYNTTLKEKVTPEIV